jgi:hypothetical protein
VGFAVASGTSRTCVRSIWPANQILGGCAVRIDSSGALGNRNRAADAGRLLKSGPVTCTWALTCSELPHRSIHCYVGLEGFSLSSWASPVESA